MASKAEQLLIVVSILEGRQFPRSPRHSLMVEARFDGETLWTEPVEHTDQPHFCTELCWEIDRRTLHRHRLQRTPIKLQCFQQDPSCGVKECVGYVVLELRSLPEVKQVKAEHLHPGASQSSSGKSHDTPRWYPLLSSKYMKPRPELLVGLMLENDSRRVAEQLPVEKAPVMEARPLTALLNVTEGFHQVGAADVCTDMFVLSVSVAFSTKLEQLISSSTKLASEGEQFFFCYSLLGNDVTSEPFRNLISPSFQPERASVRIRSSEHVLRLFLSQQPDLQIHLCCGRRSLGRAQISLTELMSSSAELRKRPATVEGFFTLEPHVRCRPDHQRVPDRQATVGVSVMLRMEEAEPQVEEPKAPEKPPGGRVTPSPAPKPSPRPSSAALEHQRPDSKEGSVCCEVTHTRNTSDAAVVDPDAVQTNPEAPGSYVCVPSPDLPLTSSPHHYRFSLDLRSVRDLGTGSSISCVLRYSHHLLSGAAPVCTSPAVELRRNAEVFLPRSCYAFDFSAPPALLQDSFLRLPLLVQMCHRDREAGDVPLGSARVPLPALLTAEKSHFLDASGQQCWRRSIAETLPVCGAESLDRLAELSYVAILEDLGLAAAPDVPLPESPQPQGAPSPAPLPEAPTPPRETLEYKAALELEMWKEMQEDLFGNQLKQKELDRMEALKEELKRRDHQREALTQKKELELNLLEEQQRRTRSELERREKVLAQAEMEMQLLQREMRAEHELAMRELQDGARRLRELEREHLERSQLERSKVKQLEDHLARQQQQTQEMEKKLRDLQRERERPDTHLQSEYNLLALQKVELEQKLDSLSKAKLHYKQQWGRALKELARFKQREQENALSQLNKQQQELEQMKLRFLAAEENKTVKEEKQELQELRNQLNRLKQQEVKEEEEVEDMDGHMARLQEERDALLRTGVYSHSDRIVSELNTQIQQLMSSRRT